MLPARLMKPQTGQLVLFSSKRQMKAMMEANPQMKAQIEGAMKMMQGGGATDMSSMMPKGFILKVKGGNTLAIMEGGIMPIEIIMMKDQNKTIRLDRKNKTYSVMLDIPVVRDRLIAETDLLELGRKLMRDYRSNAERRVRDGKGGRTEFDEFYPKRSKPILDEIDTVLAGHYGFTAEELDFILNYDIKYRLGRDTETEEE
jgi:hypothetical protein